MSDYAALAHRVASAVSGIRGCVLLSRDGMVLGAHPEGGAEATVRTAWLRVAAVGEPDRCSIEFPDQTWAFVRRGSYAAFVVADVGVRPGILLDLLEQALMAGETERAHDRDAMRLPEAPIAPSGKPRTSLHKPDRAPSAAPPQPIAATQLWLPETATVEAAAEDGPSEDVPSDVVPESDADVVPEAALDVEGDSVAEAAPAADAERSPRSDPDDESEVDRILLAKEFAGLLQVPKEDDEASR
jgi:hypothetical protein